MDLLICDLHQADSADHQGADLGHQGAGLGHQWADLDHQGAGLGWPHSLACGWFLVPRTMG